MLGLEKETNNRGSPSERLSGLPRANLIFLRQTFPSTESFNRLLSVAKMGAEKNHRFLPTSCCRVLSGHPGIFLVERPARFPLGEKCHTAVSLGTRIGRSPVVLPRKISSRGTGDTRQKAIFLYIVSRGTGKEKCFSYVDLRFEQRQGTILPRYMTTSRLTSPRCLSDPRHAVHSIS